MDYIRSNKVFFYVIGVITFLFFFYFFFFNAPAGFPVGTIVNIDKGENLRSVSLQLKDNNIIRSRLAFEAFVIFYGGEKRIIPADYFFENKLPVFEVARRILKGERHLAPIKITIPEGLNRTEIAQIFNTKLPDFNQEKFLLSTEDLEGYLFPDTYFFFSTDGEKEVIKSMRANFNKKIKNFESDIALSQKTEREIIIMASIIEREAKGEADRGFISGILWKRIKIKMPLQVDVAPETYKINGLPENPVGNPGGKAIEAAIFPKSSSYLYYLHDKDGNIHYARTFTEHKANITRYLK